jgi:hypothetical protein
MSQRDDTFKGGIQKGETAWDENSLKLDKLLKNATDILQERFAADTRNSISSLRVVKQFSKKDKLKYVGDDCFGFAPDGGAWFLGDKLVAVFEAKKQGIHGNACERWWDNASTAKYINEDVAYVTFCVGEGAGEDQVLDKLRRKAKIMFGENYSFHMSTDVNNFSQKDILNIMTKTLEESITL